jgi:hypothetical protein
VLILAALAPEYIATIIATADLIADLIVGQHTDNRCGLRLELAALQLRQVRG